MPCFGRRAVLLLALAVVRPAAAAPADRPTTFQCEYTMRTGTYGVVESATLTTKGQWVRYQKRTGAGLRLLFLRNQDGTYHINQYTNDGAKWPQVWAKDLNNRLVTPGPQGDPQIFFKVAHARRIGRARVNGRTTEVWMYSLPTTTGQSQNVRVYMDVKERRPLRAETRMKIAPKRADVVTIDYKIYRWNFSVPDSFFNLPRGAKVSDLTRVNPALLTPPSGLRRPMKTNP